MAKRIADGGWFASVLRGQGLRRAGVSGLHRPNDIPLELFWSVQLVREKYLRLRLTYTFRTLIRVMLSLNSVTNWLLRISAQGGGALLRCAFSPRAASRSCSLSGRARRRAAELASCRGSSHGRLHCGGSVRRVRSTTPSKCPDPCR